MPNSFILMDDIWGHNLLDRLEQMETNGPDSIIPLSYVLRVGNFGLGGYMNITPIVIFRLIRPGTYRLVFVFDTDSVVSYSLSSTADLKHFLKTYLNMNF